MSNDILINGVEYPTVSASVSDRLGLESAVTLDGKRRAFSNAPPMTQLTVVIVFADSPQLNKSYPSATFDRVGAFRESLLSGEPIAVECGNIVGEDFLCDACSVELPSGAQNTAHVQCAFVRRETPFEAPQTLTPPLAIPSMDGDLLNYPKPGTNLFAAVKNLRASLSDLDRLIPQLNAATFGRVRGLIQDCLAICTTIYNTTKQLTPDRALLNAVAENQRIIGALLDADRSISRALYVQPPQIKIATTTVTKPTRLSQISNETGNTLSELTGLNPGIRSPVATGTVVRYIAT